MPPISAVAARMSESCVWKVIARGHSYLGCEQAAGDSGDERGERERPELVEGDVDSDCERRRLALADRRPGAPRLAGDVQQREQEQERADDDGVAVVRGVRRRHGGPSHRGRAGRELSGQRPPLEAAAAVREVDRRQRDGRRAREHQRDQREIETREPKRRQADEDPDRAGDPTRCEQEQRKGERGRIGEPSADPAADRQQRDLAERDHPDAAVEDAEAQSCDRIDGDAREGRDPVRAHDRRQDADRDGEQNERDCAAGDRSPFERRRCARRRGAVAGCRRLH